MTLYDRFGRIPFELDKDKRNDNAKAIAEVNAERFKAALERLQESGMPTMRDLDADGKLLHYTQMTDPNDFAFLLQDDYLEKAKAGMLPVLRSPRWRAMMALPDLFEDVRKDFISLYKRKVGTWKSTGAESSPMPMSPLAPSLPAASLPAMRRTLPPQ